MNCTDCGDQIDECRCMFTGKKPLTGVRLFGGGTMSADAEEYPDVVPCPVCGIETLRYPSDEPRPCTLCQLHPGRVVRAVEDLRAELARERERVELARDFAGDGHHAPGCSGEHGYPCKCGGDELRAALAEANQP